MQVLPRFAGDLVEHVRAFVVLSAELEHPGAGAVERAARKLHLDPSVLRRRLQSLAEHAGGELVAGRGRELRLTPLGTRVRTIAGELLDRATAIQTHEEPPERIVIGCTEAIASDLLPAVVAGRLRRSPTLSISVRRLGTEECISRLVANEVDVGVVRGAPHEERWPRELEATLLGRDRLWLAMRARHPLARVTHIRLRDIAREPLVVYSAASATRRRVMKELAPLAARVVLEVEGRVPALAYARMGLGVSFLSALPHGKPDASGVVLRDVTRLFAPSAFWLLVPRVTTPRVADLAAALLAARKHE
jgi:DNA-binding transcriptional LysR family regulator